jgi:hypothetical protein
MTKEELDQLVRTVSEDGYHHPHLEVHCHMALRKLEELIETNEAVHEPLDWKSLGTQGNLERMDAHTQGIDIETGENSSEAFQEDHLLHACCRLLMALQLREEARNKS